MKTTEDPHREMSRCGPRGYLRRHTERTARSTALYAVDRLRRRRSCYPCGSGRRGVQGCERNEVHDCKGFLAGLDAESIAPSWLLVHTPLGAAVPLVRRSRLQPRRTSSLRRFSPIRLYDRHDVPGLGHRHADHPATVRLRCGTLCSLLSLRCGHSGHDGELHCRTFIANTESERVFIPRVQRTERIEAYTHCPEVHPGRRVLAPLTSCSSIASTTIFG